MALGLEALDVLFGGLFMNILSVLSSITDVGVKGLVVFLTPGTSTSIGKKKDSTV
jgi:hypothetical protein